MNIAIVASEAIPFSKTGGLADVAGSLFREYLKMGISAYLFVPLYKVTKGHYEDKITETDITFDVTLGNMTKKCRVFILREKKKGNDFLSLASERVFFIENEELFYRDELYGTQYGDYPDNGIRFTFFCKSVLEILRSFKMHFDIVHCNDWQTGLIPLYMKTLYKTDYFLKETKSVLTIHNIGYQGVFPPQTMDIIGLGWEFFNMDGIEFYGSVNFLKAGIIGADLITTVSKTYSREILTPEFGYGLDGLLRKRADYIVGIPNGIDYSEWDPMKDKSLPGNYSRSNIKGKDICKMELIKRCSLSGKQDTPLLCFIGRLSWQKGIDTLIGAIPGLIKLGVNLAIIGKGEDRYQKGIEYLKDMYRDNIFFYNGFDETLAHLCYAGSDMFLMPSNYEPGGLGQLIAMRYGSIPIARKTGGIADTVEDGINGFLFEGSSPDELLNCVKIAVLIYRKYKKLWASIVRSAMGMDFSWSRSAKTYIDIYKDLITKN